MNRAAIKAWLTGLPNEARIVVAGCSIASGLVVLFLIAQVWVFTAEGWRDIKSSEPRIARLKGYQAYQPALKQAASDAERVLSRLAFDSDGGQSQTGARLQQLLRGFAEVAGLTVRGSQLMPSAEQAESTEGFLVLTVELRMQGLPAALDSFLGDVYAHTPTLKVTELNMVKVRNRRTSRRRNQPEPAEEQDLDVNIQIAALMVSE